jgi:acyl-coenzyme A thioesterase PaaI-like protein
MHGGIAATILDEIIARSITIGKEEQLWGVTLELKTKFRKPVPLGEELKVVGRVTSEGTRSFEGTAEIILPDGETAVSAEGKYIKLNAEKIANDQFVQNEWYHSPDHDDPEEI